MVEFHLWKFICGHLDRRGIYGSHSDPDTYISIPFLPSDSCFRLSQTIGLQRKRVLKQRRHYPPGYAAPLSFWLQSQRPKISAAMAFYAFCLFLIDGHHGHDFNWFYFGKDPNPFTLIKAFMFWSQNTLIALNTYNNIMTMSLINTYIHNYS